MSEEEAVITIKWLEEYCLKQIQPCAIVKASDYSIGTDEGREEALEDLLKAARKEGGLDE